MSKDQTLTKVKTYCTNRGKYQAKNDTTAGKVLMEAIEQAINPGYNKTPLAYMVGHSDLPRMKAIIGRVVSTGGVSTTSKDAKAHVNKCIIEGHVKALNEYNMFANMVNEGKTWTDIVGTFFPKEEPEFDVMTKLTALEKYMQGKIKEFREAGYAGLLTQVEQDLARAKQEQEHLESNKKAVA